MGVACELSCTGCAHTQNVYLGIGFRYIDLPTIVEWFEDEAGRRQIREYMKVADASFDCYDGLYICDNCNYLLNKVYLSLASDHEKRSYIHRYDCPRCHAPMPSEPLLDIEEGAIDCPECKQEKLKVKFYMDWD